MRAQLPWLLPVLYPEVTEVGKGEGCFPQAGPQPGVGVGAPHPAQAQAVCSLLASEPSVEEKLQKLHSEIKFALKVDNPVRPSSELWRAMSPEPSSPPDPLTSRAPLEVCGKRQILGPCRFPS